MLSSFKTFLFLCKTGLYNLSHPNLGIDLRSEMCTHFLCVSLEVRLREGLYCTDSITTEIPCSLDKPRGKPQGSI